VPIANCYLLVFQRPFAKAAWAAQPSRGDFSSLIQQNELYRILFAFVKENLRRVSGTVLDENRVAPAPSPVGFLKKTQTQLHVPPGNTSQARATAHLGPSCGRGPLADILAPSLPNSIIC
jgi:hypothetical protein